MTLRSSFIGRPEHVSKSCRSLLVARYSRANPYLVDQQQHYGLVKNMATCCWLLAANLLFALLVLFIATESKNVNQRNEKSSIFDDDDDTLTNSTVDPEHPVRIVFSIRSGNDGTGEPGQESTFGFRLTITNNKDGDSNNQSVVDQIEDIQAKKPEFSECSSYRSKIQEGARNRSPVVQVKATSADKDGSSGQFKYSIVQQPYQNETKFVINSETGEIFTNKVFDREGGDKKFQTVTVKATNQGDSSLDDECSFLVEIININDNAPLFPHGVYLGNVTENGTAGMVVMTMTAVDYDIANEGSNAKLTYSIEKNVIDENTGMPIFEIESETGVIKTAVPGLDREKTPDYSIQVVAMDGGGLKGTGTASIRVNDINDMPPQFTQSEWYTEVYETDGIAIPKAPILTVTVHDEDETNNFYYKLADGCGLAAEKFAMVRNKDGSGSLKVIKPLDYKDKLQRNGFRFLIQVNDQGESNDTDNYHVDYSWVNVKLLHFHDNLPLFDKDNLETSVYENAEVGQSLETFRATDRGGKVSFTIDRASDRYRQFTVNQNGTVSIQRQLDRETTPRHQVKILAINNGVPRRTATATLTVTVLDINDNAPRLLQDYKAVLRENFSPRKIIEIMATDDDDRSKGNGPPFHFHLDPNADEDIKNSFKVKQDPDGANGDGIAIVSSLRSFNREQQKEFHLPIVIKDSGNPPISGTSTLTVVIGDVNDNRMQAGYKRITVYNYMGQLPDTEIGRVDVYDLDDWDLRDKKFYWDMEEHPNFTLHEDTGMLTMRNGTQSGKYQLHFRVSDFRHNQIDVPANVTVTVREITQETITNSGSIRISGITAEDFIRVWDYKTLDTARSKIGKLRDKLGQLLILVPDNVEIFSVQQRQQRPPIIDVRFSANVPPYYKPVKLNGIVLLNREDIETEVGINITMVGINECLVENQACEGSCTNIMEVSPLPYLINSNKTAFVGVQVDIKPECTCRALNSVREESCLQNPCFNGGSCVEGHSGITCKCLRGYDGPRCQLTTRSFIADNESAWYPALEMCESSHLSMEFLAYELDGTLLYNGPMVPAKPYETPLSDFISVELESGNPRLLIDYGSGTLELVMELNDTYQLDDSNWHHIDVFWDTENVRMVLDNCRLSSKHENGTSSYFNTSVCEVKGVIPPSNEYLDISSPLQLGGMSYPSFDSSQFRWDHFPHGKSFNGNIRNLVYNDELYDLTESNTQRSIWHIFSVFESLIGWFDGESDE